MTVYKVWFSFQANWSNQNAESNDLLPLHAEIATSFGYSYIHLFCAILRRLAGRPTKKGNNLLSF
jgi:hypothetical protein